MRYELVFRVLNRKQDRDIPVDIRLRRLLKTALRRDGFRCKDIRELPDDRKKTETGKIGEAKRKRKSESGVLATK